MSAPTSCTYTTCPQVSWGCVLVFYTRWGPCNASPHFCNENVRTQIACNESAYFCNKTSQGQSSVIVCCLQSSLDILTLWKDTQGKDLSTNFISGCSDIWWLWQDPTWIPFGLALQKLVEESQGILSQIIWQFKVKSGKYFISALTTIVWQTHIYTVHPQSMCAWTWVLNSPGLGMNPV